MHRLSLALAVALVLGATMATDASARWFGLRPSLQWCAQYNADGIFECLFTNIVQCRAAVSGVGGFCYQNPAWVEPPPPVRKTRAKRKPRD